MPCESAKADRIRAWAWAFIAVWPFGMPIVFGSLVLRCRRDIITHQPTTLSRATGVLWREYLDVYCLWEVAELLRRVTLTGFLLLIDHEFMRLLAALLISILFLCVLQAASLMRHHHTNEASSH